METIAEHLQQIPIHRLGHQRDWLWRGWHIRYTYVGPLLPSAGATPLLMLHGFGASIGHWRYNLTPLAQERRVYALDLLGFGASQKAAACYSTSGLWVEQVYDFWRSFIRRPVILMGHSIGSLVCLTAATAHPEMVQGLILISLPDPSVLEPRIPLALKPAIAFLKSGSRPLARLARAVLTAPPIFLPFFNLVRQPRLIRLWLRNAYYDSAAVTDELVEIFTQPAFDRGAARALRAMVNADSPADKHYQARVVLPRLQIPILLFWGKRDTLVPPQLAPLFRRYNPELHLVELDNAGHCPHDECPEVVNRTILDWLLTFSTGRSV